MPTPLVARPLAALALAALLAACPRTPGPPPPGAFQVSDLLFKTPDGAETPPTAAYPIPSIRATFSAEVDLATLNGLNIKVTGPGGEAVPVSVNGAAFPNSATVTTRRTLDVNADYTLTFTAGVRSVDGRALEPKTVPFTVRPQPLPPGSFDQLTLDLPVQNPTSLAFGPDGRLYVAQLGGTIKVATLAAGPDGLKIVSAVQEVHALDGRSVLGLAVRGTAAAPELWAAHADLNAQAGSNVNTDPYGSAVTRLGGPSFSVRQDMITGIPRSAELHQVNGIAFGPDGRLYVNVGGMTNYGAPSSNFGNRPEKLMSGAMLIADVDLVGPGTVDVRPRVEGGAYPLDRSNYLFASGGLTPTLPVKVYATGLRNPYDLVWTTGGKLYATDNGGNEQYGSTPGPADGCPGSTPVDPGNTIDEINLVVNGGYYGAPNPARGQCTLEGGPGYVPPALDAGLNLSTDGLAEYASPDVGEVRYGDLLYVAFAAGDSLFRWRPSTGEKRLIAQPFDNPLDVTVADDGTIFVAEFGNNPVSPERGDPKVAYLRPKR